MSDDWTPPPAIDHIDVRKAEQVTQELRVVVARMIKLLEDDSPSAMSLEVLGFEVRVAKALRDEIDEALGRRYLFTP